MSKKRGGDIKKISDLFEKYKTILKAPQGVVIDTFIEVVSDLIGIEIPKERVRYTVHNKTLYVRVSGALHTEIKLKEKEIISHMKGRLGPHSAPKVIL